MWTNLLTAVPLILGADPAVTPSAGPPATDTRVIDGATEAVPGASPDRAQVELWIEQLDSQYAIRRTAARRQLEAAGPAILPWLPAAESLTSIARRDALNRLRRELEQQLARQSVEGRMVEVSGRLSTREVLSRLERQTENPLRWQPELLDLVTPSRDWQLERQPFWSAITAVENATETELRWDGTTERYLLQGRQSVPVAVAVSGPMRLVLETVRTKPLAEDASDSRQLLRCNARLQLEPRLRPLFAQVRMSEWTAVTSGEPLPAWNPAADLELLFPDRTSEIEVPLDFVGTGQQQGSWSLQGTIHVYVAAGREELTFRAADLVRGKSVRRGGATATIRDVRFQDTNLQDTKKDEGQVARVRVAISFEHGGPAFESYRVSLFHRSAWLTDHDQQQIPPQDFEVTAEVNGGLIIDYRFPKLTGRPVDYSFTYEAPTLLLSLPAEFRFRDLPLPAPGK